MYTNGIGGPYIVERGNVGAAWDGAMAEVRRGSEVGGSSRRRRPHIWRPTPYRSLERIELDVLLDARDAQSVCKLRGDTTHDSIEGASKLNRGWWLCPHREPIP